MRLVDWPRMPYLNDEVRTWIAQHLQTLAVDEIAVYAVEWGSADEQRRVLVATEIGLLDQRYAPSGTTARYRLLGRLYPWQAVRGVDLRVETYRLWALEHRTRWSLAMARPEFTTETESPELGQALCDFAKACAIMAEPSGWPPPTDEPAGDADPAADRGAAAQARPASERGSGRGRGG